VPVKKYKKREALEADVSIIEDSSIKLEVEVESIKNDDENIEIFGNHQAYSLAMFLDKNVDPKYFTKFIKNVERMIRGNDDYKIWLSSLRDELKLSKDAFLVNLTSDEVEIQLHHFPFNLYSIVRIVSEYMLNNDMKLSTFIVADEVIKLHLNGVIGLVPLSVTMHELAHLGKLTFLRTQIFGNWEDFYNEFKDYLDDYEVNIIRKLLSTNQISVTDEDLVMLGYSDVEPTASELESEFDEEEPMAELNDDLPF
jgi:hypothetical protein